MKKILIIAALIFAVLYPFSFLKSDSNIEKRLKAMRIEMVKQQIQARGIEDKRVLEAMRNVPRDEFVSDSLKTRAYDDYPLPIGYGQTISQPYIVAFMTEALDVGKDFKVLEIGTGSGYQASILAEIASEVYTIEIVKELAEIADKRVKKLGYKNIYVKHADGYYGWKEKGPFDAIIITAASSHIPPSLTRQLKDGGVLIIPLGNPMTFQTLTLIKKDGDKIRTSYILDVRFVPMTGKALN